MSLVPGRQPYTVIYDVDAVSELVTAVKSKDANRSIVNAVLKLCELGERLEPPHMKPLQGPAASGLRELRPKQGEKRLARDLLPGGLGLRDPRSRPPRKFRVADGAGRRASAEIRQPPITRDKLRPIK
jgi:hypothetical protein